MRRRGARARADLRPHLAVRRPGGAGGHARVVRRDAGGSCPVVVTRSRGGVLHGSSTSADTAAYVIARDDGVARRSSARTTPGPTSSMDRCKAPRSRARGGFRRADLSLLPFSVDAWGPFLFVNPDPGDPARGDAGGAAGDRREPAASTSRRSATTPHHTSADRGELEGRSRELPRVLPLPDRSSRLQQGDRRRSRRLRAQRLADLLEPDRADPRLGAHGSEQRALPSGG